MYKQSLPFPVSLFPASTSIVLQSISLYSADASVLFESYPAHLPKKDNRKKLKAVERCLERDGSLGEAELEYRIPVGDMVDMEEVEKDEVPGNPYRVQEDVEVENTVLDDAVEADVITEPKFESVVDDELETEVETFAETAVTGLKTVGKTAVTNAESVVKTDIDVMAESIESGMQNDDIRQIYYRRRLTVEIWSILPGLSCLTR